MKDLKNHILIQQYIEWNEYGRLLGMDFSILEAGYVEYRMPVKTLHLATPFAAHGGSVASLMDAALGVAALSAVVESMRIVSTVTMNMQFVSPALKENQLLAKAKVIKQGKSLLFVEAEIINQNGKTVATGTAVMNAYPVEKANYSEK